MKEKIKIKKREEIKEVGFGGYSKASRVEYKKEIVIPADICEFCGYAGSFVVCSRCNNCAFCGHYNARNKTNDCYICGA